MNTVAELKKEAKARGLKGYSKMRKAELEKLLGKRPSKKSSRGRPTKKSSRGRPTKKSSRGRPTKKSSRGRPTKKSSRGRPTVETRPTAKIAGVEPAKLKELTKKYILDGFGRHDLERMIDLGNNPEIWTNFDEFKKYQNKEVDRLRNDELELIVNLVKLIAKTDLYIMDKETMIQWDASGFYLFPGNKLVLFHEQ